MSKGYRVGSLAQDSETGIKYLFAKVAVNNYSTFETVLGTDYVVTAGKNFYITKIAFAHTAATKAIRLNHADTGVNDSAAAGTNSLQISKVYFNLLAQTEYPIDIFIAVPQNKYIELWTEIVTAHVSIEGIEV